MSPLLASWSALVSSTCVSRWPRRRSGHNHTAIAAIRRVMGASWQHCQAHWMRNARAYVPKAQQGMAAAALRLACTSPVEAGRKRGEIDYRKVAVNVDLRAFREVMEVYCKGTARIMHGATGQIYEIDAVTWIGMQSMRRAADGPGNPLRSSCRSSRAGLPSHRTQRTTPAIEPNLTPSLLHAIPADTPT